MRKLSLNRFLLINFITMAILNLAHPVTPRMIQQLQLPDEMFGIFFALMSFGAFVMAPIWGSLSDYIGRKRLLMLGVVGYGIGQLGFGMSTTIPIILFFRIISGGFSTSYLTVIMAVVADLSTQHNRAKAMAYLVATTSLGTATGSILGGVIGQNAYQIPFITQFVAALLIACAIYICVGETNTDKKEGKIVLSTNHLKFTKPTFHFPALLTSMILTVAFLNITTQAYSSTISFYVESVLQLPTHVNGLFLSLSPFTAVIVNFFISPYVSYRFDELKTLLTVVVVIGVAMLGWSMFDGYLAFVFLLLYLFVMPLAQPIYQAIITKLAKDNAGEILGMQTAARSFGMVLGSLLSGYIFNLGEKFPFLMGASFAFIAAYVLVRQFKTIKTSLET